MDDEALPRKILVGELHHVKLWLVCVAHRGVSWNKMPFQQRQLAFQAKDAASNCLSNLLDSHTYIRAQRPFPALRRTDLAPRTPLASHAVGEKGCAALCSSWPRSPASSCSRWRTSSLPSSTSAQLPCT